MASRPDQERRRSTEAEELRRVLPVVEALSPEVRVSIDTIKPNVAAAAVAAGATLVNDVGGALGPVAADLGVGWVAMHMQGTPQDMQHDPRYDDVVAEVHDAVLERARDALAAGVAEVWVDPGIGFGKTAAHNLALLAHLSDLADGAATLGARVLVGTSRKSFLGRFGDRARAIAGAGRRPPGGVARHRGLGAVGGRSDGARPRRRTDRPGGLAGRPAGGGSGVSAQRSLTLGIGGTGIGDTGVGARRDWRRGEQ